MVVVASVVIYELTHGSQIFSIFSITRTRDESAIAPASASQAIGKFQQPAAPVHHREDP
jgi:hypothetical protein